MSVNLKNYYVIYLKIWQILPIIFQNIVLIMNKTFENISSNTDIKEDLVGKNIELFKSFFNDSQTAICIVNYDGKIVEINKLFAQMFGYQKNDIIGSDYSILLSDDSKITSQQNHLKIFNGTSILRAEEKVKHKNGTNFYIQTTNFRVNDDDGNKLRITTATNVTNRLKNELLQSALLQISNLINNNSVLDENLYRSIYKTTAQLMPISNFAVCLCNSKCSSLEFPFILSDIEYEEKLYLSKEFNYLKKNNKSILLGETDIKDLIKKSELFNYVIKPKTIIGIPLRIKEQIFGGIIIKDYQGNLYSNEHKEVLELVADQIARVIERKQYETEILAAKNEAEEAVKLKSDFLAQISHEIRTPLNSILSFSQLIKKELSEQLNEEMSEAFQYIERGGSRLTRTIDLILNVSKIHNQNYKVELTEVDLEDDILRPIVKELNQKAFEKKIKLDMNTQRIPIKIVCDKYSVNQMFINLIDNAIKYTNTGSITVEPYINNFGNIQVDITDTGIGISLKFINKIFEPFMQEEQGYTRTYEGIGLGLSLVKSYAELNNAELKVKSKKNVGSVFSVIFNK